MITGVGSTDSLLHLIALDKESPLYESLDVERCSQITVTYTALKLVGVCNSSFYELHIEQFNMRSLCYTLSLSPLY